MKATISRLFIALTIFFLTAALPGNYLKCQDTNPNQLPQFLFPSFTKGIVQMKDGRKLTAVLNYNMVDEEMIFKQDKVYMVLDKPEEIDTVFLQNRRFVYTDKAFYEVVAKGKATFYIQHKGKYTQKGTNTAYGMKSQTNENIAFSSFRAGNQVRQIDVPENITVSHTNIFWVKMNGEMNKFTTERQLIKIFPELETEIKDFIKKAGADIRTMEGLMKVGNFINGLVM